MKKALTRETNFGRAKARITVTFWNPTVDLDGYKVESSRVEQDVKIEIIANGKVVAQDGVATIVENNDYWYDSMVQRGLDLDKKYTNVGIAFVEGTETKEEIDRLIEELKEELAREFEVKTEKEQEIEEAEAIIEAAEEEGIENLMTAEEIKNWRRKYNLMFNEGGEGYIPTRVSKEQYERALTTLQKYRE